MPHTKLLSQALERKPVHLSIYNFHPEICTQPPTTHYSLVSHLVGIPGFPYLPPHHYRPIIFLPHSQPSLTIHSAYIWKANKQENSLFSVKDHFCRLNGGVRTTLTEKLALLLEGPFRHFHIPPSGFRVICPHFCSCPISSVLACIQ